MSTISPGIGYRWVGEDEEIQQGDQFLSSLGEWKPTVYTTGGITPLRAFGIYKRPVPVEPFTPSKHAYPLMPPCPVHVLWAESPWDSPTVAKESVPAHLDADPGTGYRLVQHDEYIQDNDEWLEEIGWRPTSLTGGRYRHVIGTPLRRKLPVEPTYRPYANAVEAAKALEGKLIKHIHEPNDYYHPLSIGDTGIKVGSGHFYSHNGLKEYWVFTDGTPCGIRTN